MYNNTQWDFYMNNDLRKFRLHTYAYALLTAIVFGVGCLPFIGVNIGYYYGLLFGFCISIVSFNILCFISEKVLKTGKKFLATAGYLIRLPLYGFAFYMCMRIGLTSGIACILGFMTVPVSMVYVHGIKAKLSKNKKEGE